MTSPAASTLTQPVNIALNGPTPIPVVQRSTSPQSFLLVNTDFVLNIYISTSSAMAPAGSNTFTIAPLGAVAVSSASQWYANTDDSGNPATQNQPILSLMPGGTSWSPAPSQIAEVIAPLAAAIATQIAQTGIPLIANPKTMYNISAAGSGGTGSALFGASINPAPGTNVTQAEQAWQGLVGRPVKTMKIYQSELAKGSGNNNWTTTATQSITACIALGARACLCYSPVGDPVTGIGTPTAKANMAASITALSALLTGGGAPAPVVSLWQEPQVSGNPFVNGAAYKGCVAYYANTDANGTGVRALAPLFYDGEGYHTDLAAAYYPAGFVDGIAVDYYGGDFFAGKSLDTWHQLDPTKPFGIWEVGNSAAGAVYTPSQITSFLTGTSPPGNVPSVLQELVSILNSGGTIDAVMWYQNNAKTNGVNLITQASDFRIPLLQTINDAITATAPTPGLPIAAGATVTLTPQTPSAGGGFAPAQGIGYDVIMNPIAGAGSTLPFLKVDLFWHNVDVPGSLSIARETFYVPMGASTTTGTTIQGQGPQAGILAAVKIQNLDSVTAFVNYSMLSTSRQQSEHRWQWAAGGSVALPAFNAPDGVTPVVLPSGATFAKILASVTTTIGAGAKKAFLCGMHTGNIWVRLQPKTTNVFDVVLQEPVADQVTVYHEDSAATDNDLLIVAPRSPLVAIVTNTGAASDNFTFALVAQD